MTTVTPRADAVAREAARIRAEYARRERELAADTYALTRPDALFRHQHTVRALRTALESAQLLPLEDRRVLEVGCGRGDWLAVFEQFGARRGNLAGIDLDPERARAASLRLTADEDAGADVRCGDAAALPWPDGAFDIVFQSTMFTSVLDRGVRAHIARELMRVLKPRGSIVWYDFTYDNPRNPHVTGIAVSEVRALFPGMRGRFTRVTLAPPLARWLVRRSWTAAELLESMKVLNTHTLGILQW
jgi:ubiquinone/menaquinone biosynthesis C-methylase UbiE